MCSVFEIDDWQLDTDEQMGTKRKMWFRSPDGNRYLFKYPRPNSGEAWAEKIATEIACIMQIPHAEVELATYHNEQGTISKSFMDPMCELWHGNQLLQRKTPTYDIKRNIGQKEHTFHRMIAAINEYQAKPPHCLDEILGITNGVACLTGYLLFDALVSNSDRHHENWALVFRFSSETRTIETAAGVELAPTFDHASSLGRELSDIQRNEMMADDTKMKRYMNNCPSRIYWSNTDTKPLHPMNLIRCIAKEMPDEINTWFDISARITNRDIDILLDSIPPEWMTSTARQFVSKLICTNRDTLREIRKDILQ